MKSSNATNTFKIFLLISLIITAISPTIYLFRRMISLTDLILSTVTAILFLLLGYLIIRSYMLSRDKIYLWFFTSVFIWPLIYAAISFSISGAKGLVKKGLENKIGGFGDYASVMLLLDDLTQGVKLVRLSISLMLVTNILFLVPFAILYHRLTKKT